MGVERSASHRSLNVSTNILQKTQCATEPRQSADGADLMSHYCTNAEPREDRHGWWKNEAVDEHIRPNRLSVWGRAQVRDMLFIYYSLWSKLTAYQL